MPYVLNECAKVPFSNCQQNITGSQATGNMKETVEPGSVKCAYTWTMYL